jgi:hypothetical protein
MAPYDCIELVLMEVGTVWDAPTHEPSKRM